MKPTILALIALCACDRRLNPEYCLAHPEDVRCGAIVDGAPACTEDLDCPGQVCNTDVTPAVCVECMAGKLAACDAMTPVCSDDNQCRACLTDDDCPSGVCLPDGSCPAEDAIVYVTTTGSSDPGCGTRAMPCAIMQSIVEVTATRNIIKLEPNAGQDYLVAGGGGLQLDKDVTVAARGASFGRTGNGPILSASGGHTVTVLGGVIKGGFGSAGHGIACTTMSVLTVIDADIGPNEVGGISDLGCGVFLERVVIHNNRVGILKVGGSLAVSRSSFSNNVDGGINLSGSGTRFAIVNNVFWTNGGDGSGIGGLLLDTDTSTTSRLEFNSFNANNALLAGTALECLVPGFVARNNVMFGNGDASNPEQVRGTCTHVHSIVSPGALPAGPGNLDLDPMFVSAATGNLRTVAGSPTEGAGDPTSDLTGVAAIDIDGDPRAAPPDIGIDEHP